MERRTKTVLYKILDSRAAISFVRIVAATNLSIIYVFFFSRVSGEFDASVTFEIGEFNLFQRFSLFFMSAWLECKVCNLKVQYLLFLFF